MRLFIAINLKEDIKDYLLEIINLFRENTSRGNFTESNNLHLTLNFIGETDKKDLPLLEEAMKHSVENTGIKPFLLTTGKIGRFARREGDIYWLGVLKEENLWTLQKELVKQLKHRGFPVEDREYKPHLTLGRKVEVKRDFHISEVNEQLPARQMEVAKISLMKSERIGGKLVYTEIYSQPFLGNI